MNKIIFPCSADPITNGHLELLNRATTIFEEVLLVILNNPDKKYLFTLKERVKLTKSVLANHQKIKIDSHEGLLADYAYSHNVPLILRGIRNNEDLEFEKTLQIGNKEQWGRLESIFLIPTHHSFVSSSFVKSIVKDGGNIKAFVPLKIKQALEEKILRQIRLGITGSIACGKSSVAKALVKYLTDKKIPAIHIDLDELVHQIYRFSETTDNSYLKAELIDLLGRDFFDNKGDLDRKKLSESIYLTQDQEKLNHLSRLIKKPLEIEIRKKTFGKKGLILIEGTVLLENNYETLTNNNYLFVSTSKENQINWLCKRNSTSPAEALKKIDMANSHKEKIMLHDQTIAKLNHGYRVVFHHSGEKVDEQLENLYASIKKEISITSLIKDNWNSQ